MENEKIKMEHYRWAVFTPADCMLEYSFAFSRNAAIKRFLTGSEEWAELKKKGWYTAKITMTWEKTK